MTEKNYVTTNDIMRIYKVTRKTVHNWRDRGMPCMKMGYVVRFDIEEVDKWLRNKK